VVENLNTLSKEELVSEVLHQHSEIIQHKNENAYLKHQISLYQKALFGDKKEEHKVVDPRQTEIAFEEKVDLDLPGDIELQQISYHRKKGKKKREDFSKLSLPDDLERTGRID
jgi:Transposase C of IS166 homeodomain